MRVPVMSAMGRDFSLAGGPQIVQRSFEGALDTVHGLPGERVAERGLRAGGLEPRERARGGGADAEPGVAQELDQPRLGPLVQDPQLPQRLGRGLAGLVLEGGPGVFEEDRDRPGILEDHEAVEDEVAQDVAMALPAQLGAEEVERVLAARPRNTK